MYKLIETSEPLEYSLPIVGSIVLQILQRNDGRMSIYKLLDSIHRDNPNIGDSRINQSLIFLYTIMVIDFKEPYIEIVNDNK